MKNKKECSRDCEHKKELEILNQPFSKWLACWQMEIPWPASPEHWEAWNGAVKAIANYISNYDDVSPKDLSGELLEKFLSK